MFRLHGSFVTFLETCDNSFEEITLSDNEMKTLLKKSLGKAWASIKLMILLPSVILISCLFPQNTSLIYLSLYILPEKLKFPQVTPTCKFGEVTVMTTVRPLYVKFCAIWYHLHNLKNFKNTHGGLLLSVNLKPATSLKVAFLHVCFSRFLNCTNGTKLCKASHLYSCISLNILEARTIAKCLRLPILARGDHFSRILLLQNVKKYFFVVQKVL